MRTILAPTLKNEVAVEGLVEEIRKCVHCGFCNSVCPTYRQTNHELHGPRGRISLVKHLLETDEVNETLEDSLSTCLTCRACEPACPSGVQYGKLAEEARFMIYGRLSRRSVLQRLVLKVVPNAKLFRKFYRVGRWLRPILFSKTLRQALARKLPSRSQINGTSQGKVFLLQGCVQQVLTPEVVAHLVKLLESRGISFRMLSQEQCCGSLNLHLGEKKAALREMQTMVSQVQLEEGDVILSSASGCGVTLKDYGRYIPELAAADEFAQAVLDVSEYLKQFEFKKAHSEQRIAFQTPCTLQHGQQLRGLVEEVLTRTGYQVMPILDSEQCCGSAGTYSLLQPTQARAIRATKVSNLMDVNPEIVVTANVGCQLFLEPVLDVPVLHWIELLA